MDQQQLERYEFQMGATRGKLAMASDLLTDALVLVGQHGVYCTSVRQPNKPAMDLQIILQCMNESKELILKAMEASNSA
ncbi:MAG: hypothetical protein JNM66_29145 [Bryobacterales bacterium]|nr:hypothetical protein [Bryobacterales bacterium]